jgi:MFS superfamily sulfate permease-like transporter
VTTWTSDAPQPFAGNADFWRSVAASVDALLTFVVAAVVTVLVGLIGAVTFAVPLALLVRAAVTGRRSEGQTRPTFADRNAWRLAERQAVGSVLAKALVRRRWPLAR